jgi:hypothetical protein
MAGMVLKHRKHLIPMFLIEPWCLKAIRVEHDLVTTTGASFVFRCVQELRAIALSSQGLVDPEVLDVTTAAPGPAIQSCQPLSRGAFSPTGSDIFHHHTPVFSTL